MSYGNADAVLPAAPKAPAGKLKFTWQSASGTNPSAQAEIPADYIVHKMRATLRPEIGVATQELRAIRFIEVFLFLVFFPLGFALNRYNKLFGPSIAMAVVLFASWWGVVLSLIFHFP
jgi:hypothetical protein